MSVMNGGWEVDVRVQLPDGSVIRERKKAAASSKVAAQKWAESRERVLLVQLTIQHSEWKGYLTATKGGRLRHVPMTERLAAALKAHRHLRGSRVLVQSSGEALTMKITQDRVASAARRAGVRPGVHILRHTFCSHLAMGGAPARAIQELAGHQDLKTTQRYMHLSPAAVEGAIRLLDASRTGAALPAATSAVGNMVATGSTEIAKPSR
jgi:integrase